MSSNVSRQGGWAAAEYVAVLLGVMVDGRTESVRRVERSSCTDGLHGN